jgi:hypothetical protein
MTPEQAKYWNAVFEKDSAPGSKGEPPKISKQQAAGNVALVGACLAASDPETGLLDPTLSEKLNKGRLAAYSGKPSSDSVSQAFAESVLALDSEAAFVVSLRAGAKHVTDSKGTAIDPKAQANLDLVAPALTGAKG